jgi:phosphatidylinositol dimannoside acyltransferase
VVLERLRGALRTDSVFWRKALYAGVHYGPDAWVRYSPPLFGMAFGAALGGPREAVRATLRKIHGPRPYAEEMREALAVFANFASSMTDAMLLGAGRGYQVVCRPEGQEHFHGSIAAGRGVILATAQTAGWDLGGAMAKSWAREREVMVVMEPEPNGAARALHDAHRRDAGLKVVHAGDDPLAALPLMRHLREGGLVAMKFDRVAPGMRTRAARLFGEPFMVPQGPLTLAALTGAPIVPVFSRRLGFLEYQTFNTPPLYLPRRPSEAELDAAAQTLADRLEAFVRAYPTQWFRFQREEA